MVGSYHPGHFGFKFPGMKRLHVGKCGGKGPYQRPFHRPDVPDGFAGFLGWIEVGHTHACPEDNSYLHVCIASENLLLWENSTLAWHEYAHVLNRPTHISSKEMLHKPRDYGHDEAFNKIMEGWGLPGGPSLPIPIELIMEMPTIR